MSTHTCSICRGTFNKEPNRNSSGEQAAEASSSAPTSNDEETAGFSLATSLEAPVTKKARPSNTEQTAQLVSPRCGHIFHRACLTTFLASGQKYCPVCQVICCENLIKPVFLSVSETSSSSSTAADPKEPEEPSQNSSGAAKADATVEKKDEKKDGSQQALTDEDKLQLQTQINADLGEQIEQVRTEKRVLQSRFDKLHTEYDVENMSIITYMEAIDKLKSETQELSTKLASKIQELAKKLEDYKQLESTIKILEEENKKLEEYSKKLDEEVTKINDKLLDDLEDMLGEDDGDLKDLLGGMGDMDDLLNDAGDMNDEDAVEDVNGESSDEDGNDSDDEDQDDSSDDEEEDDEDEDN